MAIGTLLVTALVSFAASTALSFVATALQKRPKSSTESLDFGQTVQRRLSNGNPLEVLVGRRIVAGVGVFDDSYGDNNEFGVSVSVLSAKPCTSFHRLFLDGEPVELSGDPTSNEVNVTSHFLGKGDVPRVKVRIFLGNDNSGLGSYLAEKFPNQYTAADQFGDYCTMILECQNTDDDFGGEDDPEDQQGQNFIPFQGYPTYRAEMSGVKICDPRRPGADYADESTYVYSDNSKLVDAQCDYGWYSGEGDNRTLIVGNGHPVELMNIPRVISGADFCDDQGFTCAGLIRSGSNSDQEEVWKTYNADRVENASEVYSVAEGNRFFSETIDLSDQSNQAAHISNFDPNGFSTEVFNEIRSTYSEPDELFSEKELDVYSRPEWIAADNHIPRQTELSLQFVTNMTQAAKLQKQEIFVSRAAATCTIKDLPFGFLRINVGDVVIIENSEITSINDRAWVVKGQSQNSRGDIDLILREFAGTVAFNLESGEEPNLNIQPPIPRPWGEFWQPTDYVSPEIIARVRAIEQAQVVIDEADLVSQQTLDDAVQQLEQADAVVTQALDTVTQQLEQADFVSQQTLDDAVQQLEQADTAVGQSISNLSTELTNATNDLSQAINGVTSTNENQETRLNQLSVFATGVGLSSNGYFQAGLSGWEVQPTGLNLTSVAEFNGQNNVILSPSHALLLSEEFIPVDHDKIYRLNSRFLATVDNQSFYAGIFEYDDEFRIIDSDIYIGANDSRQDVSDGWVRYNNEVITGEGVVVEGGVQRFSAETKYIKVRGLVGSSNGAQGDAYVSELWFEDVTGVESNLSRVASLTTITDNQATVVGQLVTQTNGNSSTISAIQSTNAEQAVLINSLATNTGDNTTSIATLFQTTGDQATALTNLSLQVGGNVTSINNLLTVTSDQAQSINSLVLSSNGVGLTDNGRLESGDFSHIELFRLDTTNYDFLPTHEGQSNVLRTEVYGSIRLFQFHEIDPNRVYRINSRFLATVDNQRFYVGTIEYDENFQRIGNFNKYTFPRNTSQDVSDGWVFYNGFEITGTGSDRLQFSEGTKYIRLRSLMGFTTGPQGVSYMSELWLEDITDLTGVENRITAAETVTAQNASSISSVSTVVGSNSTEIVNLRTTTDSQATTLSNLSVNINDNASSISNLLTVTSDQAQAIQQLETTTGTNTSTINQLSQTTSDQALVLGQIQTTTDTNTSTINQLSQTTSDQALTITSLSSLVDGHSGQINTLFQVNSSQATQLNTLSVTTQSNVSEINNLFQVTSSHATQLTTLSNTVGGQTTDIQQLVNVQQGQANTLSSLNTSVGDLNASVVQQATAIANIEQGTSASIVFRVRAGSSEASLELVSYLDIDGDEASTLRIDADNILLNGTILSAHIQDLAVDTIHLQDNAVTLPEDAYDGTNRNIVYNSSPTSLSSTTIITKDIQPSNGSVAIFLDVEFGIQSLGNVIGGPADVFRGSAFVDIYRRIGSGSYTLISTKKYGQYIRDNDPDPDERFDLTELSNTGVMLDRNVGTQLVTYQARARVNLIQGANGITGFIPRVEEVTLILLELKK